VASDPEVRVVVRGLEPLAAALRGFPEAVYRDIGPAGERAARTAASAGAGATPRITGALAGSVFVNRGEGEVMAEVGYGEVYGGMVEFGGWQSRPYVPEGRYLGPAGEAAGEAVRDECEQAVATTVRGYRWPQAAMQQ
jgi:phage gpG-like protein